MNDTDQRKVEDDRHLKWDAAEVMYEALKRVVHPVCDACCPSKWKTSEEQPHSPECIEVRNALALADGRIGR
jgi:hypothetical protein